jgi:hypothetical protein
MAGQTFVPEDDGQVEGRCDRFGPGPGPTGLLPFPAVHVEGQSDDEVADIVLDDEGAEGFDVALDAPAPPECDERPGRIVGAGSDRDADPSLAEVDPERPAHDGVGDGLDDAPGDALGDTDDGGGEGLGRRLGGALGPGSGEAGSMAVSVAIVRSTRNE